MSFTNFRGERIIFSFRTTKRTISITTLHNNDHVPLYTRGHNANIVTEMVDRTSAYPALERETLR